MATGKGAGGRRRTTAQQAQDALAAEYCILGFDVREIAAKLGLRSSGAAHASIKRGLRDRETWKLTREEMFTLLVETLHLLRRKLFEVVETPHYLATAGGKIATAFDPETGNEFLVLDDGPKVRALAELRQLTSTLGMFADLKPAAKSRVEHIGQDVVNDEIEKLAKELGDGDGKARRRSVPREP